MKVELLNDIPVERKHKMTKGRILEVVEAPEDDHDDVWVQGEGEKVRLLTGEYKQVKE